VKGIEEGQAVREDGLFQAVSSFSHCSATISKWQLESRGIANEQQ
jgi:hypothetical protein